MPRFRVAPLLLAAVFAATAAPSSASPPPHRRIAHPCGFFRFTFPAWRVHGPALCAVKPNGRGLFVRLYREG